PVIFETLADFSKLTSDTDLLREYVRQSLSSQITKQYTDDHDLIKVITTSPEMENLITSNIQQTEHGNYLAIEPQVHEKIIKNIAKEVEKDSLQNEQLVVVCSPTIRRYVNQLLERNLPQVAVLSYNELDPDVQVQSVGVVNVA